MAHEITRKCRDGVAVLIATGPSLTAEQIDLVREDRDKFDLIIGCNDAYRACDFLDVLYAADERWIRHHLEATRNLPCDKYTVNDKHKAHDGWPRLDYRIDFGFSTDASYIHAGQHSGYAIINLAYLLGVRKAILIGFDAHSGGNHFFGRHPTPAMNTNSDVKPWLSNYRRAQNEAVKLGYEIINCTPGSAIDAFPKRELEDVINGL